MSKPTKATRFIHQQAQSALNSGAIVNIDERMPTVDISWSDNGELFMQGEEAENFIAERDALTKRYPSLSDDIAELALAYPYVETLSN